MLGASLRSVGRLCSVRAICRGRGSGRGIGRFSASSTSLIFLPPIATTAAAPTSRFSSSISHYSDSNYTDDGGETHGITNRETNAYSAIELALDSVVKIFTVSSSPNYLLPWQNKSQRETMGSGIRFIHDFYLVSCILLLPIGAVSPECTLLAHYLTVEASRLSLFLQKFSNFSNDTNSRGA